MRDEARAVFEKLGDDLGLAQYWWSTALEAWFGLRAQETVEACERALEHLERTGAGEPVLARVVRGRLLSAHVYTPLPVEGSISRIEAVSTGHDGLLEQAWGRVIVGLLLAMKGDFGRARELARGARQVWLDAGMHQTAGGMAMREARIEWLAGDDAAAERLLREGIAGLEAIRDRGYHGTVVLQLAKLLYARGQYDEVREWCAKARATTGDDDVTNLLDLDVLDGLLLAREGRFEEAVAAAERATRRLEGIQMHEVEVSAHSHLAEIHALTGKSDLAREHGSRSLAIARRKGDVALEARLRESLAAAGIDAALIAVGGRC